MERAETAETKPVETSAPEATARTTRMRRLPFIMAACIAIVVLSGVMAYERARPLLSHETGWREIAWPFPRDGWPAGRAFRCGAASCGEAVELYVRPKIGFCNCDSGVADDDEVDRVADLDLLSPRFAPLAPGNVVRVADMSGRVRAYDLNIPNGAKHAGVGIALSRRCDLLVAVAKGEGRAEEMQRATLEFLARSDTSHWILAAMDQQ